VIDDQRLAYTAEVAVNWCEGWEPCSPMKKSLTARVKFGQFPVVKRPMRQWMLENYRLCGSAAGGFEFAGLAGIIEGDAEELDWEERGGRGGF